MQRKLACAKGQTIQGPPTPGGNFLHNAPKCSPNKVKTGKGFIDATKRSRVKKTLGWTEG